MIKIIIVIIAIVLLLGLLLVALSVCSINHVKCPKCGATMYFEGNIIDRRMDFLITEVNDYKHLGYPHVYKCPKCGTTKII